MSQYMAQFKPPWSLTMVSTYGFAVPEGRGVWQARWRYGDTGDLVHAVLMDDGRLSFRANSVPSHSTDYLDKAMQLPERWLDSTEITAIMASLPIPSGFDGGRSGAMTLRSFTDHPPVWEISIPGARNDVESFVSWTVYIDVASGEVLAEQLSRKVDYDYRIVLARQRLKNGDWVDLNQPGPDGE